MRRAFLMAGALVILGFAAGIPSHAAAQNFVGKYDATKSFDGYKTYLEITGVDGSKVSGKASGESNSFGTWTDYSYTLGDQATAQNQAQAYISGGNLVSRFHSGSYYTLQSSGQNLQGTFVHGTRPERNRNVLFIKTGP